MKHKLHIAIPLLDELVNIPGLLKDISEQDCTDFAVYFCVNQPDGWWNDPERIAVCERNAETIEYIGQQADFPVKIIDRSTKGRGWKGKDLGVGWARKVVMDTVMEDARGRDIIITLDGDTTFNSNYFRSVQENFSSSDDAVGLSVPYYHRLTGHEPANRAILRYEIYMRNYAINLWRIQNPYHFTALGSAMAVPAWAYKAIGGMTPKKSGEDFYFLQKLRKYGRLMTWNEEKVYPAARFSDRVFFGTGPAMIKGDAGDWDSYPVYHHTLFEVVRETYNSFEALYEKDIQTPMDAFIGNNMRQKNIWEPLRANSKTLKQFKRACRDKIDGLRILQYLKSSQEGIKLSDEQCLLDNLQTHYPENLEKLDFLNQDINFEKLSVSQLDAIRNTLVRIEEAYQKENHYK